MDNVDVLIAGGGSAGVAAAVSAARKGATVLLVERQSMLGGMGSAALVHTICGLYYCRESPGAEYAHEGFPREFAERLRAMEGASEPVRMGRLDVLPHHPVTFALLADAMLNEAKGLTVWLQSEIAAVGVEDGTVRKVEVVCSGIRHHVRASQIIDCSGDANLIALAGGEVEQVAADRLQRPGYVFEVQGLKAGVLSENGRLKIAHQIVHAVKLGELPSAALGTGFRASIHPGEAFVTIDLKGDTEALAYDPTDPACLAEVVATGRFVAKEIVAYLRGSMAGFENAWISAWPARPGVRESRRAVGRYRLTAEDFLRGATFDDAVAVSPWPMELREKPTGPRWRYPEADRPCQIPLRALQSASFANVYVAGRCLSCDHETQASIRVMGTCMATGEAAGIAAAAGA